MPHVPLFYLSMQRSTLPSHPSLPRPPHSANAPSDRGTCATSSAGSSGSREYHAGMTFVPTATSSTYPASYSSHYAQALQHAQHAQAYATGFHTTGYYGTGMNTQSYGINNPSNPPYASGFQNSMPTLSNFTSGIPTNAGSWYTPGTCSCSYQSCKFVGSAKSLEIHRMDRHLIYPPGWKEKKRKADWDADPSLIGCV